MPEIIFGEAPSQIVPQVPTNPTSHVSVSVPVLPEEVMAQITEICDLGLHRVALGNNIKNNVNQMNIVSPPMTR